MNHRQIKLILIAALVGCFVWLVLLLARPGANMQLIASPHAAVITIDGTKKARSGSEYLKPGQHTLSASLAGFTTKTQTFTVVKGTPLKVVFLLMPDSEAGNLYLKAHQGEQTEREQLGGQQYDNDSATVRKIYPIITQLPHQGSDFTINYGASVKNPHDPYAIALFVDVPAMGQESRALNWIRYAGYDPGDYEIIYQYQAERD
ncbi:MAG: hypothetical protein ABIR37_02675 [Candidatus Saccharimonadales bacterium]